MWKHDHVSEVQAKLLTQGVVEVHGEVDDDMVRYMHDALTRLRGIGSPPIEINITSGGGNVMVGLDIYDMLRAYSGQKTGLVIGHASSIAAVILQACDTRQVFRHATILIHLVSAGRVSLEQLHNKEKLRRLQKRMEEDQRRIYGILRGRTRQPLQRIQRVCKEDREMTSEEAYAFGLVDEIRD